MPKKNLEIEYTVEEKDFLDFSFSNFVPKRFKILKYIVFGTIFFSIIFNPVLLALFTEKQLGIMDFLPLIIMTLVICLFYFRIKKSFKTNQSFQNPIHAKINLEEIDFKGQGFDFRVEWSNINKVIENKNYFLVYTSDRVANIISKTNLKANQISEFKSIINSVPNLKHQLLN